MKRQGEKRQIQLYGFFLQRVHVFANSEEPELFIGDYRCASCVDDALLVGNLPPSSVCTGRSDLYIYAAFEVAADGEDTTAKKLE